jgi:hypothetical protein
MKRLLLATITVMLVAAGCAAQTTWEDPYYQQRTGPQPRPDPLGR